MSKKAMPADAILAQKYSKKKTLQNGQITIKQQFVHSAMSIVSFLINAELK